jgi:ribosomal protein S18 acetylase RimI-like enzyme
MTIRDVGPQDREALQRFFAALPAADATFVKENVDDPDVVQRLADGSSGTRAWVSATEGGEIEGLAFIRPLHGWSSHVGDLRLMVHPEHRRRGIGRVLTQHALLRSASEMGLEKVLVEVIAEQEALLQMFSSLGFEGEAILRNQIRDRSDQMRDLVLMAHFVGEQWSAMTAAGVDREFAG